MKDEKYFPHNNLTTPWIKSKKEVTSYNYKSIPCEGKKILYEGN